MTTKKTRRFKVEFEVSQSPTTSFVNWNDHLKQQVAASLLLGEERNFKFTELLPLKRKYLVIELQERNGEQEYRQWSLDDVHPRANNEKIADEVAKHWYDDPDNKGGTAGDDGYYHCGGRIHVSVLRIMEVTKEEFELLSKFI